MEIPEIEVDPLYHTESEAELINLQDLRDKFLSGDRKSLVEAWKSTAQDIINRPMAEEANRILLNDFVHTCRPEDVVYEALFNCTYPPGSVGKTCVLALRYNLGIELWFAGDLSDYQKTDFSSEIWNTSQQNYDAPCHTRYEDIEGML